MSENTTERSSKRILEPIERVSEVLFGLIMVLGFTGSMSAAQAGRGEIRTMLFGAIGCNLAWGLIDGIMYLMACLSEKGQELRTLRAVRRATDPQQGQRVLVDALPAGVASVLQPAELERMRQHLTKLPEPPRHPRLRKDDWRGAVGVFLLVFLSTFPVVLPFIFMSDTMGALRLSNLIAIGLLFITGYFFGRCAELRPWRTGVVMVLVGLAIVG
ncbi:MAG: VIT1/CCC1 transporter family protein, partial [Verrucomicrobia bacterium]|nr:VIT1/CCC1 transporter family protein [Verrucomicrobiota bacterium]